MLWWGLGAEIPLPFPICPLNVSYSDTFPICFVNVYSYKKKKKYLDLLMGVFCSGYTRIISCSSVAACQCDVWILCTFIMCMRCIGFAVAVIRETSSHATQRKKHAVHLCEHNTVVGGQSVSTVNHKVLLFCIPLLKLAKFWPCYNTLSSTATIPGCRQGVKLTNSSSVRVWK